MKLRTAPSLASSASPPDAPWFPHASITIGAFVGITSTRRSSLFVKLRLDDVVDAVPVHFKAYGE